MTLTNIVVQSVIQNLLKGEDYRTEILTLINASFLQYVIEFFKKVVEAKFKNENIDGDWYKREFLLNVNLSTREIIINAGLNAKTVRNTYGTVKRRKVLEITPVHYDELYSAISSLSDSGGEIDVTLTIKLGSVSVDLNISETLIVINTLAVKRAELRGGFWSSAGKRVEGYLMLTLCELFRVPSVNRSLHGLTDQSREVDFHLINTDGVKYLCEIKLMGKGNPESADAAIARDTQVFVADTLSNLNKTQLTSRNIHWVELRTPDGYKKFFSILQSLDIPSTDFEGELDEELHKTFIKLFPQT